jgi:TRAP-type C4-dicarboxylate transport system permease small subunit
MTNKLQKLGLTINDIKLRIPGLIIFVLGFISYMLLAVMGVNESQVEYKTAKISFTALVSIIGIFLIILPTLQRLWENYRAGK